jgi:hypothetical protein
MARAIRKKMTGIAALLWLLSVGAAFTWINRYSATPGDSGVPPDHWPSDSTVKPAPGKFTLLVFLHPRCPCSRATLREFETLVAKAQDRLSPHLLFAQPAGSPDEWANTDLWRSAQEISGARPEIDLIGREATRFMVQTSGTVLLYDPNGRLLFHGGITPQRGHSGANAGSEAILRAIYAKTSSETETAVFGCPLFDRCNTNLETAHD